MRLPAILVSLLFFGLCLAACSGHTDANSKVLAIDTAKLTKEVFSISNLVAENKIIPDSIIKALNAQHHQLNVLEK